jgi:predicted ATP-binding protein involved in virulence
MKTIKKKTKLSKNAPIEIQELFEYVASKNFPEFTSLPLLKYYAYEYLLKLKELNKENYVSYLEKIKNFDFYEVNNYTDCDEITEGNKGFFHTIDCFRDELAIIVRKEFDENLGEYILRRQVSPPLSAYKKVGTHQLNIKVSTRDYGLTFE